MDPVSLIEFALASGAVAGVKNTASSAVTDAYKGLKAKVKGRFVGRQRAETVFDGYEADPEKWKELLLAELAEVGADDDLVVTAQALMRLIDPDGSRAGKYKIDARGSHGVQIGDGNTQHNIETFINTQMVGTPPPPATPEETIGPNTTLGRLLEIARDKWMSDKSRLDAAEQAAKRDKRKGALAYQAIALDRSVSARWRRVATERAAALRER
jgi:hypothetical protein